MSNKPKILYLDIENSHDIIAKFGLYPEYTSPSNILQGWFMFCACWKWEGSSKVDGSAITDYATRFSDDPTDDFCVVYNLREVIMKADVIVAHNGDKFDLPKFNTRLIYHNLSPIPNKLVTIDTLKLAKKHFKFTSNRLDYLGKFLGYGGKLKNPEGLWLDALQGDKKAIEQMFKYCKRDVTLLQKVFKRLKPYSSHALMMDGLTEQCNCGGELNRQGTRLTAAGLLKQRLSCRMCGKWYQATIKTDGTLGRIGNG